VGFLEAKQQPTKCKWRQVQAIIQQPVEVQYSIPYNHTILDFEGTARDVMPFAHYPHRHEIMDATANCGRANTVFLTFCLPIREDQSGRPRFSGGLLRRVFDAPLFTFFHNGTSCFFFWHTKTKSVLAATFIRMASHHHDCGEKQRPRIGNFQPSQPSDFLLSTCPSTLDDPDGQDKWIYFFNPISMNESKVFCVMSMTFTIYTQQQQYCRLGALSVEKKMAVSDLCVVASTFLFRFVGMQYFVAVFFFFECMGKAWSGKKPYIYLYYT
jgi:hypothetical protein